MVEIDNTIGFGAHRRRRIMLEVNGVSRTAVSSISGTIPFSPIQQSVQAGMEEGAERSQVVRQLIMILSKYSHSPNALKLSHFQ